MKGFLQPWAPPLCFMLAFVLLPTSIISAAEILPLRVVEDRCECVLDTEQADESCFLVVGSLAQDATARSVHIQTEICQEEVSVPLAETTTDAHWQQQIQALARQQERARAASPALPRHTPAANPPRQQVFYVYTGQRGLTSTPGYTAVVGRLQAVGKHCLVYVDRDHTEPAVRDTVAEVVRVFDQEVYPSACRKLGQALDVDRNGRFTMLLTPWLSRLAQGQTKVSGYVRGADFLHEVPGPYSNHCDMLYLDANLKPGPFLRTVLAHEFTHAIIFSEHVFGQYVRTLPGQDEESWLNEGICHLVEDAAGYSWDNLDYRISAFLSAPAKYPLVVPDYYSTGLWRVPGLRGNAYLFVRWCADQQPELLPRLIRSNLHGAANVEAALQEPFAELFRRWCVALILAGRETARVEHQVGYRGSKTPSPPTPLPASGARGADVSPSQPLRGIDLHAPLGRRLLSGPYFEDLSLRGGRAEVELCGTAAAYYLLHSPGAARTRLSIRAEAGTQLQVSLVRLPRSTARLQLRVEPQAAPGTFRVHVTAQGGALRLQQMAWESRFPVSETAANTSFRPEKSDSTAMQPWFGTAQLAAGESCVSSVFCFPSAVEGDTLIIKLSATDEQGRRVTGWVHLQRSNQASASQERIDSE